MEDQGKVVHYWKSFKRVHLYWPILQKYFIGLTFTENLAANLWVSSSSAHLKTEIIAHSLQNN